jgi:hypothetical protein
MENSLNLKVTTTKADYDAFYAYTASYLTKSYCWIPMLKNIFLWIVLAFTFMSFFQFQGDKIDNQVFFSVLTVSISFLSYVALCKFMEIKVSQCFTPNENGMMVGPKEFEIGPDGIKETHPFGHNFYNWDVVEKVEEVNGSVYVFVDKVLAIIFPPESFGSVEFKEEVLVRLKQHV